MIIPISACGTNFQNTYYLASSQNKWGLDFLLSDTRFMNACSSNTYFKKTSVLSEVFVEWCFLNMQTHACQHGITQPYGWILFVYLASHRGMHCLIFMGRNLDNREKLTPVWLHLWIVFYWYYLFWIILVCLVNSATMNIILMNIAKRNSAKTFSE